MYFVIFLDQERPDEGMLAFKSFDILADALEFYEQSGEGKDIAIAKEIPVIPSATDPDLSVTVAIDRVTSLP